MSTDSYAANKTGFSPISINKFWKVVNLQFTGGLEFRKKSKMYK